MPVATPNFAVEKWLVVATAASCCIALAASSPLADKPVPSHVCQGSLGISFDVAQTADQLKTPVDLIQLIKTRLADGVLCVDPEVFARQTRVSGLQWRVVGLPEAQALKWFGQRELHIPGTHANSTEFLKLSAFYGDRPGIVSWNFASNTAHEKYAPSPTKLTTRPELDAVFGPPNRVYEERVVLLGKGHRYDRLASWIVGEKYAFWAAYTVDGDVYSFSFHARPIDPSDVGYLSIRELEQ